MLTQARLKEILHYDSATGIFTGLVARGKRTDCIGRELKIGNSHGYLTITIHYKRYPANKLAFLYMTGEWPILEIDHKNRKRDDNRWENLRQVTHQQNSFNHPIVKKNTSGVLGVSFDTQTSKWRASISPNGKTIHLGRFSTIEAALLVRIEAEKKYFGEHAGRAA